MVIILLIRYKLRGTSALYILGANEMKLDVFAKKIDLLPGHLARLKRAIHSYQIANDISSTFHFVA